MRPLFFDFSADPSAAAVEDQFLLGPDLLVAPILHRFAQQRQVYLPAGMDWRDAWSNQKLPGGQWLTVDAPLERIPYYFRRD